MKHNLDTDVDPTANHGARHGYEAASLWRNRVTGRVFVCVNPSDAGAIWAPIGEAAPPEGGLARVAYSGSWRDLDDRPALGAAAALPVGTEAGTVASGADRRIDGALQADANLSDLADPAAALANLGLNLLVLRLIAADDLATLHRLIGLGDVARRSEIARLQPRSDALDRLSGMSVGAAGEALMAAASADDVRKQLRLVPGETVQPFSRTLSALSRIEAAVLALVTAPNLAAVRGLLEIEPGQKHGPPANLAETLAGLRSDVDEIRAHLVLD